MSDDELRIHHIRPRRKTPVDSAKSQLRELFGGKGGGGGRAGSGGGSGGGAARAGLLAFVIVISIWLAFTSWFTVDTQEDGVVLRFGAYHRTVGSGFHLKLPYPIEQTIILQSKKLLKEEFGFRTEESERGRSSYAPGNYKAESLMLTGDLNVADVEWVVQYRISDPWKYLFHVQDVRRNIRDVSMSIMRRVVGDMMVSDVLTTGRAEIRDRAKVLTQEVLDTYDMGIKIENILLQGVNPPEAVKPAFNEVNAAKQEQEQTINNAEREYNKVIPEARGKAQKEIADAEAYAIDLVNRAKGDAAQFQEVLSSYKKDPEITRRRLYLDAMEEIFSKSQGFTVIDSDVKGVLPLHGAIPTTPSASAAPASPPATH